MIKPTSLSGRLILTILCIEATLALFITAAALYYQHRQALQAFDVMLRGRADSVLGSVQDAEDAGDSLMLDKTSIAAPSDDVYEVREEGDRLSGGLAGSLGGTSDELFSKVPVDRDEPSSAISRPQDVKIRHRVYRVITLRGQRMIDPDQPGPVAGTMGTVHHIVVLYGSPLEPVNKAAWRAARFFLLADALALAMSVAVVASLIRRSLRPLADLALHASRISPRDWSFQAPASAHEVAELRPLASALEAALRGLEQSFQQQRTFVNDAAHELKTAVTVLKSSLQLLVFRERTSEQYRAGIEGCLSDCGRMEDLVQRMLLLARVEQAETHMRGTLPATPASVSLAAVARTVMTQIGSAAQLRQTSFRLEVMDDRAVALPEEECSVLLTNLLMNAVQYSRANTTIALRVIAESETQTRVSIVDEGAGIDARHLPFVFESFYRADASRSRDTGGTGLGLSICKAIVTAYGGSISIASELAVGTTVTLILPVALASAVKTTETVQTLS